jgi:hypothetical protein
MRMVGVTLNIPRMFLEPHNFGIANGAISAGPTTLMLKLSKIKMVGWQALLVISIQSLRA